MGSDRSGPALVDEHETFMDLVAAYALDAVDDLEEPVVEQHLDSCADCRHDLRRHHEILALLGSAAPATPPSSVWRGIDRASTPAAVASSADHPTGLRAPPTDRGGPQHRRDARHRPLLLVAAALIVLTAVLGVLATHQRNRAGQLSQDLAGTPVDRAAAQAEADGRHEELSILSADGHLRARILIDDEGSGYFIPNRMAALPADRTYQLWGISGGAPAQPVSLGVLGAHPVTIAFHAPVSDTTFAITDEPADGSQGPTTPVLASAARA